MSNAQNDVHTRIQIRHLRTTMERVRRSVDATNEQRSYAEHALGVIKYLEGIAAAVLKKRSTKASAEGWYRTSRRRPNGRTLTWIFRKRDARCDR